MQPILVSGEAPFMSNFQKKTHWSSEGHDPHWTSMTLTGPMFFFIGCIRLVWAEAENANFHFCYAQAL